VSAHLEHQYPACVNLLQLLECQRRSQYHIHVAHMSLPNELGVVDDEVHIACHVQESIKYKTYSIMHHTLLHPCKIRVRNVVGSASAQSSDIRVLLRRSSDSNADQ
jgi:hypothetical protein